MHGNWVVVVVVVVVLVLGTNAAVDRLVIATGWKASVTARRLLNRQKDRIIVIVGSWRRKD
jgi:NADPH-dependent 2,4-dienoyl-CoA reductase/sulfur reductase-like enzyme